MPHSVLLSRQAKRFLEHANADLRTRLDRGLAEVADSPMSGPNIRRLGGALRRYWRRRVGDYRIIYGINTVKSEIQVDSIRHRRDAYE